LALAERDLERQVLRQASRAEIAGAVAERSGVPARLLLSIARMRPGIPWDGPLTRETKMNGTVRTTLERSRHILQFADTIAAQVPGLAESLACERLEAWFARTLGIRGASVRRALLARGFSSYREFIDVARSAYVHAWLGSDELQHAALAQQ